MGCFHSNNSIFFIISIKKPSYSVFKVTMESELAILFYGMLECLLGVCVLTKKYFLIFSVIFSIMMIRQYFAECVIVLVHWQVWDCRGQLTRKVFVILHILCSGSQQ